MAAQQQQQGNDSGYGPIWLAILVIIVGYVIWVTGHQHIVAGVFYLNVLQAKLVDIFLPGSPLAQDIYLMQTLDPMSVNWGQLVDMTQHVGDYMRYPVILTLSILAIIIFRADITQRFRKIHNMKTLSVQEQHVWPAIMPVIKEDLVAADISEGPWAMAMTPMEFARKHKLLRKNDALLDNSEIGMEKTASIRRGDAKRVFTMQLGPYWNGFEHCPPHVRALAAIFMARINRDRGVAKTILDTLDQGSRTGKMDYSVANETIKKYAHLENVQEIVAKHAYLLTTLASLLQASRDDGVMPTSEFLWVRPLDRRLWYMLNCVGRQTPFTEVGGPFAHWLAEKKMGRRSLVPMIDEAIKALEIAVKEVKLSPKELQGLEP